VSEKEKNQGVALAQSKSQPLTKNVVKKSVPKFPQEDVRD